MDRRRWVINAAATLCGWPALASAAMRKPWPPRRATPALHLLTIDGQPWTPAALHGHPLLLNFWASWCEPCRSELPALEKFALEQREAGVRVLAVNYRESAPTVRRFLGAHPLALDVLRDADGAAARAFGVNIFPSTIVIDREGRTKLIAVGELEPAELPGLAAAAL